MDDLDFLAADLKPPAKRFAPAPRAWTKPLAVEKPTAGISANVEAARTDSELQNILAKSKKETVVINFGSSFCHSCHNLFPHFYQFTSQFSKLKYVIAQIDYMNEEARDLEYTPTFRILRQGKVVDQFYGADKNVLEDRLWLQSD